MPFCAPQGVEGSPKPSDTAKDHGVRRQNNIWRYFYYGSRFYEAASRSRCTFRSPDKTNAPRWNPKMAPYIYTERNGIYIIDLQKTVKKLDEAYNYVKEVAAEGGDILFVGTKKQAQESIRDEALRCGMHYVNARWLGGMLTNFRTIRKRIDRMDQLAKMKENGTFELLPKKEVAKLELEMEKLDKYLGGVKNMKTLPKAMFIVDPHKERIAVAEARKLNIPIVAIVDTNCNPDEIDYVIPGNDDAIRAVKLIAGAMADAVLGGQQGNQEAAPAEDAANA